MTQNPSPEPDPQPHPSPLDVWALARRDYLAGEPAAAIAERYGLSVRTVRRHAAQQGWRRRDADQVAPRPKPAWEHRMAAEGRAADRSDEIGEIVDAHMDEQFDLLIGPDPTNLRLFAFRRAAECAALDRPTQAVLWMRLVQQLDRSGEQLDVDAAALPQADYIRAAYLKKLKQELLDNPAAAS